MKSDKFILFFLLLIILAGCGGSGGSDGNGDKGTGGTTTTTQPAKTLSYLTITPGSATTTTGATQSFGATGTYSDNSASDMTYSVAWSSSNPAVATINSSGTATGVTAGVTTITALSGSISARASLTVVQGTSGGGSGDSGGTGDSGGATLPNVVPITVNGSLCSSGSYPNKPCVSVKICTPGSSTCQVVNDILLDTGSYGLRVFRQAIGSSLNLPQVASGGGSLAECVQFGDGSSVWGPVQSADVILGNEPAVQTPVHVIDANFGTLPRACQYPDASPSVAGFNGILGVGLFKEDCGNLCASSLNNGMYYSCTASGCARAVAPISSQVQNPVALLPVDNNGVLVQLPSVPSGGVQTVSGNLILGVGTRSNNTISSVTTYPADSFGNFVTQFNGSNLTQSFIDSGSNGLYFPASSSLLPACGYPYSGFYCPSGAKSLTAVNSGYTGSPSGTVNFTIGNFATLMGSSNNVFSEIGGNASGGFDWGLPFYFGRNVFLGIDGKSSNLGRGPYWAY